MGKRPKNRNTKNILVFDEKARHDFLTGFKKRKDERRKKANLEMEIRIKEQQKQMKEKHRAMLKKAQTRMQKEAKDVDDILQSNTFTSTDQTVTVTYLGDSSLMGQNKLLLGKNQMTSEPIVEQEESKETVSEKPKKHSESLLKTHKLTKKNKLIAKPSYKKSKHKNFSHGKKKGGKKKEHVGQGIHRPRVTYH